MCGNEGGAEGWAVWEDRAMYVVLVVECMSRGYLAL